MNYLRFLTSIALIFTIVNCDEDATAKKEVEVDFVKQFKITEAEQQKLVTGIWKKVTTDSYKTYLKISSKGGFYCFTDGKSESFHFKFLKSKDEISISGQGEFGEVLEKISFIGESQMQLSGSEKGTDYTMKYELTENYPEVCKKMEKGQEVPMEELKKTWESFMIGSWISSESTKSGGYYYLDIKSDATGKLCRFKKGKTSQLTTIKADFDSQLIDDRISIGVTGEEIVLQETDPVDELDVTVKIVKTKDGVPSECSESSSETTESQNENVIQGIWKEVTTDAYKTYLKITSKGAYSCNTDGKSGGFPIRFIESGDELYILAEGESEEYKEKIEFIDDTHMEISGEEKGQTYTFKYELTEKYPSVCEKIEKGEDVPMEELKETWEHFMIGSWLSSEGTKEGIYYYLDVKSDATGKLCKFKKGESGDLISITADLDGQEILDQNIYIGVGGDDISLQEMDWQSGTDESVKIVKTDAGVPTECSGN